MSQYDFGTINPSIESGADLAVLLGNWRTALYSQHSGTTRPHYAVAGMIWRKTGAPAIVYYYDGASDIPLYEVNETDDIASAYTRNLITLKNGAATIAIAERDCVVAGDASSGALTLTLPASASVKNGFAVTVIKKDSSVNVLTLARSSVDTINDATSLRLSVQYQCVRLVSDGVSAWYATSYADNTLVNNLLIQMVKKIIAGTGISVTATGPNNNGDVTVATNALLPNATAAISKGFTLSPNALGNMSSFAINPALGNYQYGANVGAVTITAPMSDCAVTILITNGAGAGSLTLSGFIVSASTGDPLTTINGDKFLLQIVRLNGVATYWIKSLQ